MEYLKSPTACLIQSKNSINYDPYYPNKAGKIYLVCETEYTDHLNNETVSISFHYYVVEDNMFKQLLLPPGNNGVARLSKDAVNTFAANVKYRNPTVDLEIMTEYDRRIFMLTQGIYLMVATMTDKPYGLDSTDFEDYVPIELPEPEPQTEP